MHIILTHQNADFDAVASLLGAHKLYPQSVPILPKRVNRNVAEFLALYRGGLPFIAWQDYTSRQRVHHIILTDTQSAEQVRGTRPNTPTLIIEHHPPEGDPAPHETLEYHPLGAITTYLVEQVRARHIPLTTLEATLLALGIYEDTGMLTYSSTTPRDVQAVAWLLEQGAVLDENQQALLEALLAASETLTIQGYTIMLASARLAQPLFGINSVASQLREMVDTTALIVLVQLPDVLHYVARSADDAVNIGHLAQQLGGGGHARAAAATIHQRTLSETIAFIKAHLQENIQPAVRVADLMSHNPRTVEAQQTVKDLIPVLRRIGHEGYPVLDDGRVIGLLTLRDADRAIEHGLSKATVRDVMQSGAHTLTASASVYALEQLMVNSGWGQIPVVNEQGVLVGIVTRTDLLKHWARTHPTTAPLQPMLDPAQVRALLGAATMQLIERMAAFVQERHLTLYMVGGVVRDLLLQRSNQDIDFVVEGDGIALAQALGAQYGGRVHGHQPFGTAKWHLDETLALDLDRAALPDHLDFVTARNEFYAHPTALPTVYSASIRPDMARRDFTMNTLAVQLSPIGAQWRILDLFGGIADLEARLIRVLHSLSFVDDPTRILRAVRLSERLHFVIEPRTAELMATALPMLRRITGERLRNELTLLLHEAEPERGLLKLEALRVLEYIYPTLHYYPPLPERFSRLRAAWPDLDAALRTEIYWYLWLTTLTDIRGIAERLLLGGQRAEALEQVAQLGEQVAVWQTEGRPVSDVVQRLERLADEALTMAAYVLDAPAWAFVAQQLEKARTLRPVTNGHTLKTRGVRPGPAYKRILDGLRAAWLDGLVTTPAEEDALLRDLLAQERE